MTTSRVVWPRTVKRTASCMVALCAALIALLGACTSDKSLVTAQNVIRTHDYAVVRSVIDADIAKHRTAIVQVGKRLAPGFLVAEPERRAREMRLGLKLMRHPKKGVSELVASPVSFVAAIDDEGVVIARDRDDDTMAGKDFGARFAQVRTALVERREVDGLGEFNALDPTEPSSWSMLFAAPALDPVDPKRALGAVLTGIPLWRWAQRLSRELRLRAVSSASDSAWVYVVRNGRAFFWDTPPEVDNELPSSDAMRRCISFTPEAAMKSADCVGSARILGGELYAFGIFPLPALGDQLGIVIFRPTDASP